MFEFSCFILGAAICFILMVLASESFFDFEEKILIVIPVIMAIIIFLMATGIFDCLEIIGLASFMLGIDACYLVLLVASTIFYEHEEKIQMALLAIMTISVIAAVAIPRLGELKPQPQPTGTMPIVVIRSTEYRTGHAVVESPESEEP